MTNLSGANLNSAAAVAPQGEGMESPSTFPKYPTYKDSGVEWLGEVPQHWSLCRMAHLEQSGDDFVSGPFGSSLGSADYIEEGIPVIRGVNTTLRAERRFIEQGFVFVSEQKYLDLRRCNAEPGDIVFTARGTVGKVALVPCSVPISLISPNQLRFRPRNRKVVADYFFYMFSSENLLAEVFLLAESVAQPNMNLGSLKSIRIMLPSPPEQTQIVRFLDHETARIDALIEEQQRLIELLKEKRQAVIFHAVTKGLDPTVSMKESGVEWLGEVPEHWGVVSISRIFEIRAGGDLKTEFYSDVQTESYKYPIFTNATNESAIYGYTSKAIFPGGTITVTGRGDVGYAIFRPQPYDAIIRLLVLRPVRDVQAKLYAYMINAVLTFSVGSSAISQLSAEQIAPYKLLLPPMGEQIEILALLDRTTIAIDALVNEAHRVISLLQERRSALISAVVTGKIDVRGWQPPVSTQAPESAVAEAN